MRVLVVFRAIRENAFKLKHGFYHTSRSNRLDTCVCYPRRPGLAARAVLAIFSPQPSQHRNQPLLCLCIPAVLVTTTAPASPNTPYQWRCSAGQVGNRTFVCVAPCHRCFYFSFLLTSYRATRTQAKKEVRRKQGGGEKRNSLMRSGRKTPSSCVVIRRYQRGPPMPSTLRYRSNTERAALSLSLFHYPPTFFFPPHTLLRLHPQLLLPSPPPPHLCCPYSPVDGYRWTTEQYR